MSIAVSPRAAVRLLSAAALTLATLPTWAAAPDPYGDLLDAMDWPEGRPFLASSSKKTMEIWKATSTLTFTEVTARPGADRSRIVHRLIAEAQPVPEKALAALKSDKPETNWLVYWVKTRVEPINGASPKRMFSMAERRLVRCEQPVVMVDVARLYFGALDTTGEPFSIDTMYRDPPRLSPKYIGQNEQRRLEYTTVCGPVIAAAHGAENVEATIAANLAPPPSKFANLTPEQQKKMLEDILRLAKAPAKSADAASAAASAASDAPAAAMAAASAASEASAPAVATAASAPELAMPAAEAASATAADATSTATAPSEPLPLGSAKARIRLFAQNGTAAGVSNEAACVRSDSIDQAGAGFMKNLASMLHAASNESLGMPESETTRHLSDRSTLASKAYFVERAITAEMPATVDFTFAANNQTCPNIAVSFVPEAGADYESRLDRGYGYCFVSVGRITPSGAVVPVPVTAAPRCPPEK